MRHPFPHPQRRTLSRLLRVLPLLALLIVATAPTTARALSTESVPGETDQALYEPVLVGARDEVLAETAGLLSRYQIEATLTPPTADQPTTLTGTAQIRFHNGTGQTLNEVYFRLYANDDEYAEGALTLQDVAVAGQPATAELDVADTAARVALPSPLPADDTVDLTLAFTATVPTTPEQSYGIYSFAPGSGTWALAHWYPIIAGYGADGRWNLDPPSENGDPIFSNTSLYDVAVTTPRDLVVVATGSRVTEETTGETTRHRFVTGPVRDFTLVVDDDFAAIGEEVDGTLVTSYYNPDHAAGGEAALRYGVQALALFNDLVGPYPYEEMDLVDVSVRNGAAGVEFPQLMFIGGGLYDDADATVPGGSFFEDVVAHEVGHQWWYALVGNDQYRHAFIDEGLNNYFTAVYFERLYGPEIGARQSALRLERPYLRFLFSEGDLVADQPTDAFPSMHAYDRIVYSKAPLGFAAIRSDIGDDAFFGALRDYAAAHRFAIATPADLLAAFERAAGRDLDELWRHWFEAAEGTLDYAPSDLDALEAQLGN